MRLQLKVNLVCLGALVAVACAVALAGLWTIDQLSFDLNSKLLSAEVENMTDGVRETYDVLKVSGVAAVKSYVDSAQRELLHSLSARSDRRIGRLTVVQESGETLLDESSAQNEPFEPACLETMRRKGEGALECVEGGPGRFYFFRTFTPWNWLIALSLTRDEMFAMRGPFLRNTAVIVAVSLLLGGAVLVWLTRGVVGPVRLVAEAAKRLSRGEWEATLPEIRRGDEVGALARAFADMARELSAAHRDLERQAEALGESNQNLSLEVGERRRAEAELAELNRGLERAVAQRTEDLARQAQELVAANQRLLEMDALKSAFLSSVSHELRTPLTSILGFAKLISKDFLKYYRPLSHGEKRLERSGERISQNLAIVEHEGRRLTRMINDFLDLAKIESGKVDWRDQEVAPGEIIERAVDAVRGDFAQKPEVALRLAIAADLPVIRVDPDRIEQVLINLLNNAVKFTPRGEVSLTAVATSAGDLELRVKDSGVGVPEKEQALIFDKFHQALQDDTLKEKPRGTGLGLTISRQIVEHYDGSIAVVSSPGRGAEFIIVLPGARKDEVAALAEPEGEQDREPRRAPLILVVDDDPAVRSYLSQFLRSEGCRTATAQNGREALDRAAALKPDLITMDLVMPGMDGRTAIERIHANPETARIPVLVISILQEEETPAGDAMLRKPVDEGRLLAAINNLLGRSGSRPAGWNLGSEAGHRRFFILRDGRAQPVDEPELMRRVADGFRGTVFIPTAGAGAVDASVLSRLKGVQAVFLPADIPPRDA